MSAKSLCCVWTLLLLLQQTLCFSLEKHCARRCLYGRGGIICRCNAIHFTGKRSFDPKHSYSNPQLNSGNRHDSLLSILNRPEFLKSLAIASLSEQEDRPNEVVDDSKPIQFIDNEDGNSEGLEKDDNAIADDDPLSRSGVFLGNQKLFQSREDQKRDFPLYRYNGLTSNLAQLVKNAWQHFRPPTNVDIPEKSFSSEQIEPTAEVYDNQNDNSLPADESGEDDILSNSQAKVRARLSFVQTMDELIKRLPTLIHRYKSDSYSGLGTGKTQADDVRNLAQPGEGRHDVKERKQLAWNRLMKYLAHTLSLKERHRSKRDESEMAQPGIHVAKSD